MRFSVSALLLFFICYDASPWPLPRPGRFENNGVIFNNYYPVSCEDITRVPTYVQDINSWYETSLRIRQDQRMEIEAMRLEPIQISLTGEGLLLLDFSLEFFRCDYRNGSYLWHLIPTPSDHRLRFSNTPGSTKFKFDRPVMDDSWASHAKVHLKIDEVLGKKKFARLEAGETVDLQVQVRNIFTKTSLDLFHTDDYYRLIFSPYYEFKAYLVLELSLGKDPSTSTIEISSKRLTGGKGP